MSEKSTLKKSHLHCQVISSPQPLELRPKAHIVFTKACRCSSCWPSSYLYFSAWLLFIINIYAEYTIDIRRHKEARNSYKYEYVLLASPSTQRIRNKNTNSVPSSIYHNLWLKTIYIYIYIYIYICACVCVYYLILTQSKLSDMLLCINFNFTPI